MWLLTGGFYKAICPLYQEFWIHGVKRFNCNPTPQRYRPVAISDVRLWAYAGG
jgi:hypothetical protein